MKRVIFLFLALNLVAQAAEMGTTTDWKQSDEISLLPVLETSGIVRPLDRPVDPDEYRVGPGDLFLLNFNLEQVEYLEMMIAPAGDLLIPGVGDLQLAGLSLTEARQTVLQACHERYPLVEVFFTLQSMRTFNIYLRPAGFPTRALAVTPATTVGDLLRFFLRLLREEETAARELELQADQAYEVSSFHHFDRTDISGMEVASQHHPGFNEIVELGLSYRNIRLHRDDSVLRVDLLRAEALRDPGADFYLREGDVVEIPPLQHEVQIEGGVLLPGIYEYVTPETVSTLMQLAGGLTPDATAEEFLLYRFTDNLTQVVQTYPLIDAELQLQEEDFVFIRRDNNYHRLDRVEILGEVRWPGVYPIEQGVTTVAELLELAGGRLTTAAPDKLLIVSQREDLEALRLRTVEAANLANSELSYLRSREQMPPGSVYLGGAVVQELGETLALYAGDRLYVPRQADYVEVIGAVNAPGRQPFSPDFSWRDYVRLAGGKRRNATRHVFVVKPETGVRIPVRNVDIIRPGDVIFVEEKEEVSDLEFYKDVLSITASLVMTYAVVLSILRR